MEIEIKVSIDYDEDRDQFYLADFVVGAERTYVQALEQEPERCQKQQKAGIKLKSKSTDPVAEKGEKYR